MPACHGGGHSCADAGCTSPLAVTVPDANDHKVHGLSTEAALGYESESSTQPLHQTTITTGRCSVLYTQ